jgi:hypothetical protein
MIVITDQVCNYVFTLLFTAFPRSDFMSVLPEVLPQKAYGNMTLIFLSYFHGYTKIKYL